MSATEINKPAQRPRIIVLENSHVFAELLSSCITGWFQNPEVVVFDNGDEAFTEIIRRAPDLLMTDRIHAGLNGEELLRWLAARQVRFPILLLSSDLDCHGELFQCLKLVRQPKPFNRHSLWKALNELVGPCDFPVLRPDSKQTPAEPAQTQTPSAGEQPEFQKNGVDLFQVK